MVIALSGDHTGFRDFDQIRSYLETLGHQVRFFGPEKLNPEDDYPDFIKQAAKAVASGECKFGIVIGGSGQGEAMSANRMAGVRCAVFYGTAVARQPVDATGHTSRDPYEIIKLSRQHNDANMLSLAARFLSIAEMKKTIELWLATDFSGDERHQRRINKLEAS